MCDGESNCEQAQQTRQQFHQELAQKYGELVPATRLWRLMGYPSAAAFRQAVFRAQTPIRTFRLEHRRGVFAAVEDLGDWLIEVKRIPLC